MGSDWDVPAGTGGELEDSRATFGVVGGGAVVPLEDRRRISTASDRRRSLRLLIVAELSDDHELLHGLLSRAETARFQCDWADTGEHALRRLTAGSFDACIVSAALSDRTGLDFVRAAQRRGLRTPMILLADELAAIDCQEAIEVGVADLVEREELDTGRVEQSIRLAIARRLAADRLDELAQHDALTGLAKRALFNDRLERALGAARRHRNFVAVVVVDMNGFKSLNGRLGHQVGDEILRTIGDRLKSRVRETDTVSRLGGDEFALVIENLLRPEHAALVARKLLDALAEPALLAGGAVPLSAALGVALYPRDGCEPEALVRLAAAAMGEAKAFSGSACRFHDERLDQRMRRSAILEADLRRAMERDELVLHYQPQVSLGPTTVAAAAIIRWQHPSMGMIEADRFRSLAEETGLMEPLTEWLVDSACRQARIWADEGLGRFHLCLPLLSRRQLAWSALATRIGERVAEAGLDPSVLEVEIDERIVMEELEAGGLGLQALAQAGVRIAVDGFGGSATSLRLLRDAPLSTIRLSRELVQDTPRDEHRALFVRAVVRLGKQLGLRVVVEGVDSNDQLRLLRQEGCDAVQAFISCPPLPPDACVRWLTEARLRPDLDEAPPGSGSPPSSTAG